MPSTSATSSADSASLGVSEDDKCSKFDLWCVRRFIVSGSRRKTVGIALFVIQSIASSIVAYEFVSRAIPGRFSQS